MDIPAGVRYSGEIEIERYCHKFGLDMVFNLVFSGTVESVDKDLFRMHSINPYQVTRIFKKKKEFTLFLTQNHTVYNVKCTVKKTEEDGIIFYPEKSSIDEEKRRFHRFYFCCKDLGDFSIQKNNSVLCENACVYELSRSGMGILNPCIDSVKKGDLITVKSEDDSLEATVEVIHAENRGRYDFIGGRVKNSNQNLINYIIKKYIKVSEEIINELG
ncbi:hypothetical protein SAMN06265182_1180 [Persephonella hydrogeniphila]|uniref:PilZ domain-containing protein n=1 Tax=Persephonella hydrogeniphila TaxID=198703 RepID=A0A285NF62_9AQUI|nr:hypothetical protein [Persephonella hydrogeniphila]SNZ08142.1 hypothetical protein SAMN06265182_1180 [Persephonella hydrogeniphila]